MSGGLQSSDDGPVVGGAVNPGPLPMRTGRLRPGGARSVVSSFGPCNQRVDAGLRISALTGVISCCCLLRLRSVRSAAGESCQPVTPQDVGPGGVRPLDLTLTDLDRLPSGA